MADDGRVTLLGAGLAGSLLAVLLARRGFAVDIYEKRVDLRRHDISAGRSINLALAERGILALERAGLADAVRDLLIPMRGRMIHALDGATQLQPYSQHADEVIYSVSRGGLNALLMDAAEATGRVDIHFEQESRDFDLATSALTLRDTATGAEETLIAAPVIAADGAGSPIRHALKRQLDIDTSEEMLAHGYKELTIPPGAHGRHLMDAESLHIWPRGGYMLIALPNLDGSFTVTLFLPHEGENSFAALDSPAAVTDFFQRQFPDALALIPDLEESFFANPTGMLGTVRCNPWHADGQAVLIGDAAHAVVPFHGQGMNCAFEDCRILDECVDECGGDWNRALPAFSKRRVDDANAIADMALENYVEMRDSVRDPKFQLQKELGWVLERRHPGVFVPRYSMVMFRHIPYAQAKHRGAIQCRILEALTRDIDSVDQADLAIADRMVAQELAPAVVTP